jgi:hypothetical protein
MKAGKSMVKVLTIRDPKTGALIAEGQIQPKEDRHSALTRIYGTTLGPNAPEFMVITKSIWLDDRQWAAELARDWSGFELALLGPKEDCRPEKSRLVLARVSEYSPVSRMDFPIRRTELDAITQGRRHDAVVPVNPEAPPAVGDTVTFREVTSDPFGTPVIVPNGDSVSVELTEVGNQGHKWVGQDLYRIAWDPAQIKKGPRKGATHGVR